jgi:hypothetical protein
MSEKQCNRIDIALRPALLPALGFARNLPLGIVLGPLADGGLNIHATNNEQGLRKVLTLVGHLRQGGRASTVIRIALDWCQLIAGVSYPILCNPGGKIPHKEKGWITTLRSFLNAQHLSIHLTSFWSEPQQRKGDLHLMDKLGPRYTPLKATRINYCRLWLRVSRLSDITHTNGKSLIRAVLYGDPLPHRRSSLHWPRVPRPPDSFWKLWRAVILQLFSIDGKALTLRDPLGAWLHERQLTEWQYLYDPTTDRLLSRDIEWLGYRAHLPTGPAATSTRCFGPPSTQQFVQPSNQSTPVMAQKRRGSYIIQRPRPITRPTPPPAPSTFWKFVDSQPTIFRRLLFDMRSNDDTCQLIAQRLRSKTTIQTATDGGVLFEIGAFAWVFDLDDNTRIRCSGPADCTTTNMEPKRAELYGILSFLTFIRLVMEYFKISPTAALQIHCDDKNTINEIAEFRDMQHYDAFAMTKRCCANYDLIDEILLCFKTLPMTVRILYVNCRPPRQTLPTRRTAKRRPAQLYRA